MKTPREQVLEYYPDAIAVNVGTRNGKKYYNIKSGDRYLGQGKSSTAAWIAASRNI